MEVAGTAVGIASLGIQVCQGLLAYYEDWRGYSSDVSSAYDSINDLSRTLILLRDSLNSDGLDEEREDRVKSCIRSCEESLEQLSKKSQKLRKYGQPENVRQRAWAELQRAWYPFRAGTLAKLRDIVADGQERLKLAVQVLELDISMTSQRILKSVAVNTSELTNRTAVIETSVAHISSQNQQILDLQQSDHFRKIKAWLSACDPWTNHATARQRHEPHTGAWLLQSDQFQRWKAGDSRHLWLYGKAGCGKTVLFSSVIEDIRTLCESAENATYAMFYFTFSDNQKQLYEDLLRSLVTQLGWKEPALSMLTEACERLGPRIPGADDLSRMLLACTQAHDEVFVLLDALDESPESNNVRESMLAGLERLASEAQNVRMFVTSREISEIGEAMQVLGAAPVSIAARSVDADIQRYTASQLLRDRKLSKLSVTTKGLIADTIAQKADGMFRWAYCQLQELRKLKSTKPKYVQEALRALPSTLDGTYERILLEIDAMLQDEAIVLLQWLAYAQSPPTLGELAEASIIDLNGEGSVDVDNRGSLRDTLEILAGLVTCETAADSDVGDTISDHENSSSEASDASSADGSERVEDSISERFGSDKLYIPWPGEDVNRDSTVRLAHFSVKEYLESTRIDASPAKKFLLEAGAGHRCLAQSCLTYLMCYSNSKERDSSEEDSITFPLLRYAGRSWFHHSRLQTPQNVNREMCFLTSDTSLDGWLSTRSHDWALDERPLRFDDRGPGLYYASFFGLHAVVRGLLAAGVDVEAWGGDYGFSLKAASSGGYSEVVETLLDAGAQVDRCQDAPGGILYGNSLQIASAKGQDKVVELLLERGADVNVYAQEGSYETPLQVASDYGYTKTVKILLEQGANINGKGGSQGGKSDSALQLAATEGHKKIVEMLLDRGADVNAQGDRYGNALQAAAYKGHKEIVEMLLDQGANINAQEGIWDTALQAASSGPYRDIVEMLIERGANVNAQGGHFGNALQGASYVGDEESEEIVEILLKHNADVNAQGGRYGTALQAASAMGHGKVVGMLLERGADVNAQGGDHNAALIAASLNGHEDIVEILLERGADINARGKYGNALQAASSEGSKDVVETLIERGADVTAEVEVLASDGVDVYWTALQAAQRRGQKEVIDLLIANGATGPDFKRRRSKDESSAMSETPSDDD